MNLVKKSKNFIEGLRSIGKALVANDETSNDPISSKELYEIRTVEDANNIARLENEVTKVYISLDDSGQVAPKAKVSEQLAKERLEQIQIKTENTVKKEDRQNQIGD